MLENILALVSKCDRLLSPFAYHYILMLVKASLLSSLTILYGCTLVVCPDVKVKIFYSKFIPSLLNGVYEN